MKRLYWKLWWWRQDRSEARFVRRALEHAESHRVTYIHPTGEGPAVAAIIRVGDMPADTGWDHTHLEGTA